MSDAALQALPENDQNKPTSKPRETSPGGSDEVRWEIVARTPGFTPATILAGRLRSEGIPVRVWQEGAGQALGLTVGILGTGYVAVPEGYAETARDVLTDVDDELEAEDGAVVDDEE